MRSLNVKARSQKDKAMYETHLKYGYTLEEIAEYIGIDYATVSRVIRKIERKYEK
jgi:DNA-binding MarR family transcriptional regulator